MTSSGSTASPDARPPATASIVAESLPDAAPEPEFGDPVGPRLYAAARGFALAGGALLCGLTLLSVISILGRSILARPLPGDYEIAQLVGGTSVALFLPYCQMRGGNVLVDFFTTGVRARTRDLLDVFGSLVVALIAVTMTWRTFVGMVDLRGTGELTMILGIPTWIAYVPMVPAFALLAAAAIHRAWQLLARHR